MASGISYFLKRQIKLCRFFLHISHLFADVTEENILARMARLGLRSLSTKGYVVADITLIKRYRDGS